MRRRGTLSRFYFSADGADGDHVGVPTKERGTPPMRVISALRSCDVLASLKNGIPPAPQARESRGERCKRSTAKPGAWLKPHPKCDRKRLRRRTFCSSLSSSSSCGLAERCWEPLVRGERKIHFGVTTKINPAYVFILAAPCVSTRCGSLQFGRTKWQV